jgi:hypothetical protein
MREARKRRGPAPIERRVEPRRRREHEVSPLPDRAGVILAGLCEQGVTPNAQAKLDVSALSPNADDLTYSCNVDDGDNVTISNHAT